jgi:hypothetical protein
MAVRLLDAFSQYFSDGGEVLTDGQLRFLASGTNDLIDTFSDINLANPNANPLPLLAGGRVPSCFGQNRYYKIRLEYTDGTLIQEIDPVGGIAAAGEFSPWNSQSSYLTNQIVSYNGLFWISTIDGNQDNEPGVDAGWDQFNLTDYYNPLSEYVANDWVLYLGAWYKSKATSTGQTPSVNSAYWDAEKNLFQWNSTTTYPANAYIYEGDLRYKSMQSTNLNHQPSTDTSFAWWKPEYRVDLESSPQLIKVRSVTGGGALLAEWCNVIEDGNSGYTLPLANSVPSGTYLVITKSDIARTLYPIITSAGSDTIRWLGGTDTSFQIDTQWADSMILYSNGTNQWSF